MAGCQFKDQRLIQWLHEAHVGYRSIEVLCRFQGIAQGGTEVKDSDFLAFAANDALADLQRRHFACRSDAGAAAARVADGTRALVLVAGIQHLAAFVFITRCHDHHIRDTAHKAQVECALVGLAIRTDQATAVNRKHHRQIHDGNIVDQLVITALQEGRINRDHRMVAPDRHAGCQSDGVLLGNSDIEVLLRVLFRETYHAGAFAHGRGDRHQLAVLLGHIA